MKNTDTTETEESLERQSIVLSIDKNAKSRQSTDACGETVPDVVTNTFESAIALAEQDPLLQYVASWLRQDLEWLPLEQCESLAVDVTLSSSESMEHKIGLSFSHGARDLPPPPIEFGELVLVQEHKRSLSVCLAQLCLSEDDQQRLEPGSCIVLPETFKQTTTLNLFDPNLSEIVTQVVLDRSQNRLVQSEDNAFSKSDAFAENERQLIVASNKEMVTRVFLQQPVTIDMSSAAAQIDLAPLLGQMVVVQCDQPEGEVQYAAQLIEIGSGLAVLLEGGP